MIDLTDDEPPRKVARLGNNSRNEFRNSVSTATAPSPSMPAANLQEIIRTQSISSPRNSTNNQTSSSNADQTHSRKRTASGSKPFSNASLEKMMYAPMDYGGRPQSGSSNPPSRPNHLPGQSSMPGPALQDELRGLVGYQAPTLHNSPHIGPQVVQPQVPNPRAPSRYNSPYVVQTQGPNALAPQPQSTDLAHPLDLLNNISLSVASLETFQLQQILSTAALRHPDVLEHLRTSFRIQETNKSTAHQALLDLLRAQSQGELRIARLQEERSRKGSAYNASPYGPTPSNAPAAPAYNASPYGPPPPNAPAVPPFAASAAPTQAPGPASSHADLPPQVTPASRS
ncbi:hypothetical protein E4T52_02281 [Aureobasidium sp. EXF-3400]|nr:hypothetical protein E4T51_12094 [Aureobasidium sp. EXF-12344]KAI4782806.1 hypothetical protein E4T52_02281 [Aureobasidium sp. EXF-3400]